MDSSAQTSRRSGVSLLSIFRRPSAGWRSLLRGRELSLVVLAALCGVVAGVIVTAMSRLAHGAQALLFGLEGEGRLSAMPDIPLSPVLLVPAAGGVMVGISIYLLRRFKRGAIVDPIEANALHGGRLSLTDSVVLAGQTLVSNGCGASVGLEAGYTQLAAGLASRLGLALRLRRQDVRLLVGCGAAGAIAAAFDAPLTGAFYAFELIIGVYSVAMVAPVMTAAISATLTARVLGAASTPIHVTQLTGLSPWDYVPFIILGLIAGLVAVAVMRCVTLVETGFEKSGIPRPLRPMLGGLMVGGLALYSPQVLSAGHAALHINLTIEPVLSLLAITFAMKVLASSISLGAGFRGGLFFASLFLGALLGRFYAEAVGALVPGMALDPVVAAVVGMSALGVGIVGGPLTMTFMALETSGSLAITGIALTAAIASALTVRETFGYSFSTWRLHLRGETIRSAQDIGWMRNLTVGRMMRSDAKTAPARMLLSEFREKFPLGSTQRVILVDETGRYAGIVTLAEAFARERDKEAEATSLDAIATAKSDMLLSGMTVKAAAEMFERAESEELAVVSDIVSRKVVGLLTEAHLLRRYTEEMDKARRGLLFES